MTDLSRFVAAQEGVYDEALGELRAGHKHSHWMWFVLPQVAGLGRSSMAQTYALSGMAEARAYAAHPVLGPRLRECGQALLALPDGATAQGVLGGIDALKLRSSMTLFARACPEEPVFAAVLDRFYAGEEDELTVRILDRAAGRQ